ncbi:DUF6082 family protein [Streptomyces sp. NPDC047072]|uniref:DUF6082 family protein n=1 Tax=Streptomyces sp. NPDC047072 TaxID=3154809 RepID=UPI0033EDC60A
MAAPDQEACVQELLHAADRMADGLARVAEEMRLANKIRVRELFAEQMDRSIDDAVLAAALSTLRDLPAPKHRQMLFANKHYSLLLLAYEARELDRGELLGHLKVLSRNAVFAEYWQLTSEHRKLLPWESLEARTGRAVDVIMDERLDDLEEWWVVDSRGESR